MNIFAYVRDKGVLLFLNFCGIAALFFFLRLTNYPKDYTLLICVAWVMALTIWMVLNYLNRRRYFMQMQRVLDQIDQRYLLGELMPSSVRMEDRLYRQMIRCSNQSVIETVRKIEKEQKEYQEYMENWVHEMKAPITTIALICENNRDENMQRIQKENDKLENYVDVVLYYARSGEVYKDYVIQETDIQDVVFEVMARNKYLLIENNISVEVNCPDKVYSDKKWIIFIMNQIILNCVKYSKEEYPMIQINTWKKKDSVLLIVEDNGIGIGDNELPRIFEKGFTGSNGRNHERATGMGLYLCKKLCDKLGIRIAAESQSGVGTKILLEFPFSNFLSKM